MELNLKSSLTITANAGVVEELLLPPFVCLKVLLWLKWCLKDLHDLNMSFQTPTIVASVFVGSVD